MCGIAGVLAPGPVDRDDLARICRAMGDALVHRGPDGHGHYVSGTGEHADDAVVALAHRRLAVIDVRGGAQPLFCSRGTVGIVNGEFYNFVTLRRELVGRGHRFVTDADSEVMVHGFSEWGEGVLERLEGQFALALWDEHRRCLLLARDRMGEKPLFYAERSGQLIFASELLALLRHPDIAADIDPLALAEYLVYEYVPAPRAMIRGVHKLEPGQFLVARPGAPIRRRAYWDLPLDDGPRPRRLEPTGDELRRELERSVTERLVADVPLGVFLSGGLDSSLVAALACRARDRDVDTFSLGFSEPSYDESPHARRVARFLGTRHHERIARPRDALELIRDLGGLLDEPLGDASIVPTHLLARFTRQHVTVALSGDGGDELFGGYPTFVAEWMVGRAVDRLPRTLARALERSARALTAHLPASSGYFSRGFKLTQLGRGLGQTGARRHQAWLASFVPDEVAGVLAPDVGRTLGDLYDVIDRRLARCRSADPDDRLLYFYSKGYLGDDVLGKVDRASMQVALEVRAPLLDTAIIALACRAHPSLRTRGLTTKRVLKRAARGLLPDDIIDRPKHGFAMPVAAWLRGPLADWLQDTLAPVRLRRDGWFADRAVADLVRDHLSGRANHRKPLWTLLALHAWLDRVRAEPT